VAVLFGYAVPAQSLPPLLVRPRDAAHPLSRRTLEPGSGHWIGDLPEAVHAEWTKVRTVPSTIWLLLATIALTAGDMPLGGLRNHCPLGRG
jgi:hypothetical protein